MIDLLKTFLLKRCSLTDQRDSTLSMSISSISEFRKKKVLLLTRRIIEVIHSMLEYLNLYKLNKFRKHDNRNNCDSNMTEPHGEIKPRAY